MSNQSITTLPKWAADGERAAARRLITRLLNTGHRVSVQHCEGLEIRLSGSKADILKAMSQTGEETISAYKPKAGEPGKWQRVGMFFLVYGNARDGSELVCDHSANEFCEEMARGLV